MLLEILGAECRGSNLLAPTESTKLDRSLVPRRGYDGRVGGRSNERICAVVARIPRGRVATYGQIALLAGLPGRARLVGHVLRVLPSGSDLPWHRVVNAQGKISPRGDLLDHEDLQAHLLEREGVRFAGGAISLERYRWQPRVTATRKGGRR